MRDDNCMLDYIFPLTVAVYRKGANRGTAICTAGSHLHVSSIERNALPFFVLTILQPIFFFFPILVHDRLLRRSLPLVY